MQIAYSRESPGLKEWLQVEIKAFGNLKELSVLSFLSVSYLRQLQEGTRDGAISEESLRWLEAALGVKFQPSQE